MRCLKKSQMYSLLSEIYLDLLKICPKNPFFFTFRHLMNQRTVASGFLSFTHFCGVCVNKNIYVNPMGGCGN